MLKVHNTAFPLMTLPDNIPNSKSIQVFSALSHLTDSESQIQNVTASRELSTPNTPA